MEQFISALTLSKRAGKLLLGFDVVKEAVQNRTAKLIVLASDLSPKTKKEVRFLLESQPVPVQDSSLRMDEIWYLLGKKAGVIAITDDGFAKKLLSLAEQLD